MVSKSGVQLITHTYISLDLDVQRSYLFSQLCKSIYSIFVYVRYRNQEFHDEIIGKNILRDNKLNIFWARYYFLVIMHFRKQVSIHLDKF